MDGGRRINPKSKYYKILEKLKGFPMPKNFFQKIVLAQRNTTKSKIPRKS